MIVELGVNHVQKDSIHRIMEHIFQSKAIFDFFRVDKKQYKGGKKTGKEPVGWISFNKDI